MSTYYLAKPESVLCNHLSLKLHLIRHEVAAYKSLGVWLYWLCRTKYIRGYLSSLHNSSSSVRFALEHLCASIFRSCNRFWFVFSSDLWVFVTFICFDVNNFIVALVVCFAGRWISNPVSLTGLLHCPLFTSIYVLINSLPSKWHCHHHVYHTPSGDGGFRVKSTGSQY